jgi:GNAT superfamily N-acetyltransferase
MDVEIKLIRDPANDPQVYSLINKLNNSLSQISGDNGAKNADLADFAHKEALFLLALIRGEPVACGGFRPLKPAVCEIKRMFALEKRSGLGQKILQALESAANHYGYQHICLETRKVNQGAVAFYLKNGYQIIENYGIYAGREEAVCFGKALVSFKE